MTKMNIYTKKRSGILEMKRNSKKTIEELNELIVEVQKAIDKDPSLCVKDLVLEIADVYNMLIQVCIIFSIDDKTIETAMDAKMLRTLRKISENS